MPFADHLAKRSRSRHERRLATQGDIAESERWNHNIHYHRLLLDAVPLGARVLDEPREGTPGDPAYGAA